MASFALCTLGCKVNSYESASYREALLQAGLVEVAFTMKADIYLINTCALTATACSKSKKMVNRAKRLNPQAFIAVVGCWPQVYGTEVAKLFGISLICGSYGKPELIAGLIEGYQKQGVKPKIIKTGSVSYEDLPVTTFPKTRAFLKIQDGCDQHCSYCIIPKARGSERSLDPGAVIDRARLLSMSHKEIVLVGIHTGRYGRDLGCDLTGLLAKLVELPLLERIRLSSIEITEVSDELLQLMADNSKLARHLHIPIQSGDDTTLQAMNRPYTSAQYQSRLAAIRELVPGISISTDVLVGFPTESGDCWENSKASIAACDFSFIHVFPYSVHHGTKAANLDNQVSDFVRKQRVTELLAYSQTQKKKHLNAFLGKKLAVIIEKTGENSSFGHSSEYLPVVINKAYQPDSMVEAVADQVTDKGFIVAEVTDSNNSKLP